MRLLLFYGLTLTAGTLLFVLLFHTGIFGRGVLFFRGLAFLAIAGGIITAGTVWFKHSQRGSFVTNKDILMLVVLFLSFNLVFFTLVPVTLDRSISVFLLEYLDSQDSAKTKDEVTTEFINKYVIENKAMDKRFNEQIVSGNLAGESGVYKITGRGRAIVKFFRVVSGWFGI
jgi:hypothetical protein